MSTIHTCEFENGKCKTCGKPIRKSVPEILESIQAILEKIEKKNYDVELFILFLMEIIIVAMLAFRH